MGQISHEISISQVRDRDRVSRGRDLEVMSERDVCIDIIITFCTRTMALPHNTFPSVAAAAGLTVLMAGALAAIYASRFNKTPQHTSKLTGQGWVNEILEGHDGRFYNELGLHKHVFRRLVIILGRLSGLDHTKHVSAEEQLAIFLHFAHRGLSNRALQERFQRSADMITKYVHLLVIA